MQVWLLASPSLRAIVTNHVLERDKSKVLLGGILELCELVLFGGRTLGWYSTLQAADWTLFCTPAPKPPVGSVLYHHLQSWPCPATLHSTQNPAVSDFKSFLIGLFYSNSSLEPSG